MPFTPFTDAPIGYPSDGEARERMSVADIPPRLRRRIEEEALRRAFSRLQMPLRLLLYATTPENASQPAEQFREILGLWRHGLEQELALAPDSYVGAVRPYEDEMDEGYTIRGTPRPGDPVRVLVPSWCLDGEVVVRGEAEPVLASAPSIASSV
jgi:hypothetical protein